MLALPDAADREAVAAYLVFERRDLLDARPEKQAHEIGVKVEEIKYLWRDPEFRALLDRFLTLEILDPSTRRQQLATLVGISLDGEKDADKIKAFDTLSRQAGLKVPERHEVDDRKSIEINVRQLPASEEGFVPATPFQAPKGRRALLGEVVKEETADTVVNQGRKGPLGLGDSQFANRERTESEEE